MGRACHNKANKISFTIFGGIYNFLLNLQYFSRIYTLENNLKPHLPDIKIPKTFSTPGRLTQGLTSGAGYLTPGQNSQAPKVRGDETAGGPGCARRRRAAPRRQPGRAATPPGEARGLSGGTH